MPAKTPSCRSFPVPPIRFVTRAIVIGAVLLAGSGSEVWGVDYFVRLSGNDTRTGRTAALAFRTVSKAVSVASAGDQIFVGAGNYSENVSMTRSGTSANPIKLIADKSGAQTGDAGVVQLTGKLTVTGNFFQVSDFKFTGSSELVIWNSNQGGVLRGCELWGTNNNGVRLKNTEIVIDQCVIRDIGGDGIKLEEVIEASVTRCTVLRCGDDGVDFPGSGTLILQDTLIQDCRGNGLESDKSASGDLLVDRCRILGNREYGIDFGKKTYSIVNNSLIARNGKAGYNLEGSSDEVGAIAFSTITHNGAQGIRNSGHRLIVLRNNIVTFNGDKAIEDTRNVSREANLFFGNRSGDAGLVSSTNISSDPRFIYAPSNDFRLGSGSPAIDRAAATYPSVSLDLDSNPRPQGPASDLGALEAPDTAPRTYYVRVDGDDSRTGLSASQAFRTINKAASVVNPGSTVLIGPGTYREFITPPQSRSGGPNDPILFRAEQPGTVVWQLPSANRWGVECKADFTVWDGIRFTGQGVADERLGFYAANITKVTFRNCQFDQLSYGLFGQDSGLVVETSRFQDNVRGVASTNGGVLIDRCDIRNNEYGPWLHRNHYALVKDTTITSNNWALYLSPKPDGVHQPLGTNVPTLTNCTIDRNRNGVHFHQMDNADRLVFTNTRITNTTGWEMNLVDCNLTVSDVWRAQFAIDKGGSGIQTENGRLVFDNFRAVGYRTGWGLLANYGQITVRNCTFQDCATGVGFYYPVSLDLRDTNIVNNRGAANDGWGLYLWNKADNPANSTQITNCNIQNNVHGAWLGWITDSTVSLTNTVISNNSGTGAQFHMSDVSFTPVTMGSRWRIERNGNGIVTYYGKVEFKDITMADNTGWNAVTNYGDVTVTNSTFRGAGNGFSSYYNRSFQATNSQFSNNTGSWGLAYASNGTYHDGANWLPTVGTDTVRNCVIENNFNGLSLEGVKGNRLQVIDTPIRNNTNYGLYAIGCEIDFTPATMSTQWKISGNGHGITTYYGKHLFDGIEIADNKQWGVQTYHSDVAVKNCRFTRNAGGGFLASFNKNFKAENCRFEANGTWGVSYASDGRFQSLVNGTAQWNAGASTGEFLQCVIENNGSGMFVANTTDGTLKMSNTPIRNNTTHGLYLEHCELSFTPATMGSKWQLANNGNGITTYYGKILFDGIEIADNRGWGVLTYYGDVTVKNSRFTRNPGGGFLSSFNKSFQAENCKFDNNGVWGVSYASDGRYYGLQNGTLQWLSGATPGQFKNCLIEKNTNGLQVSHCTDGTLVMINTPIRDNTTSGLHVEHSRIAFTQATMGSKWQLSGNGHGISTYYGAIVFDGAEISGNRMWGARTHYGDITVRNSRFTGNTEGGFQSYFNKSLKVENCRFDQNGEFGVAYYSDGRYQSEQNGEVKWLAGATPAEFKDCVIEKNGSGMRLENCLDGTLQMVNSPIRNNTTHGLYVVSSQLSFTSANVGSTWLLSGNANAITTYYGKILFDGIELADNRAWGAMTYYGDIVVKNSKFKRNPQGGFLSYFNKSFRAEGCQFDENQEWGLGYHSDGKYYGNRNGNWGWYPNDGPGQIVNCTVSRNQKNGMYVSNVTDTDIIVSNTQVTHNGGIGVAFYNSTVKLSPATKDKWLISNNVHGFHASNSNLTVEDFEVTGNSQWGMYTEASTVSLKNARFTGNGHGMSWHSAPWANGWDKKLTVDNCRFDNNTAHHGLLTYYGPVDIKNSTFNGNKGDGLYTHYNKSCVVSGCEMSGNGGWGAICNVNHPTWVAFDQQALFQENLQSLDSCTLVGNGNGLCVYNAEKRHVSLKRLTIDNNRADGICFNDCRLVWDTAAADQVVLRNNGNGLTGMGSRLDLTVKGVVADSCREYGIRSFDGKFRAENCRVTGSNFVGYYSMRTQKSELEGCRFDGAPRTGDGWGWGALTYGSSPDVRNCVFNGYPNGASPTVYGDEPTTPQPKFFNNTFANLDYYGFHLPNGQAEVRNCIFAGKAGNTDGYGMARQGGDLVHSNNLLYGFGAAYYNTTGTELDVLDNPRFVNAAAGDLHLAQGSPAINSGSETVRGYVDIDLDGNPRPSFKRWELGAYEYLDGAGSVRVLKWTEKR